MKKVLTSLLIFTMLLGMLTACGENDKGTTTDGGASKSSEESSKESETEDVSEAEEGDELEFVELSMYLLGDKPADFDMVYDQVNAKLKEDINANLTVNFLGWSEYSEKYPLLFASGEQFDLIYTGDWCFYNQISLKGGFLEITDSMIEKYAPMTAEYTTKERLEQVKVGGALYMLPYTKPEYSNQVYVVRGDIMDKYGLEAINNFDDFMEYLDIVAKNEPDLIPYDDGSDFNKGNLANIRVQALTEWSPVLMSTQIAYNISDQNDLQLFSRVEQPEFLEYFKEARTMAENDYWAKDAIVNGNTVKDSFINGKSASAIVNLGDGNSCYMLTKEEHPEWDVRIYDTFEGHKTIGRTGISNGVAINANSKNPERALMMLDLFKYDTEYYELTNYGIEGVHWQREDNNRFSTLPDYQNYPPVAACPWGWMTEGYEKTALDAISNFDDIMNGWNANQVTHPLQAFSFDDSAVKNEIAACTTVIEEYLNALQLGYFEDVEGKYDEFIQALKLAGHDEIMAEFQRQIDEQLK